MTFFKDSSRNRSSDSPPIEQYLPSDTLVTLEVADQLAQWKAHRGRDVAVPQGINTTNSMLE